MLLYIRKLPQLRNRLRNEEPLTVDIFNRKAYRNRS